jgi:hypothetical protein
MRYRRDDDAGFGSGLGGNWGASWDPHREWEGPLVTRGVNRDGSRIPRPHPDEHEAPPAHSHREHGGFSNYAGGGDRDRVSRPHFSESTASHYQQHGYGMSQYESPDWETERGPHYGKGPKGYKRSDDRIREEVCEVMSRQGFVDASEVEVTVESGVVRLTGTVETRTDKRALEQMADRVHGVEEVRNEIRLRRFVSPKGNGKVAHS